MEQWFRTGKTHIVRSGWLPCCLVFFILLSNILKLQYKLFSWRLEWRYLIGTVDPLSETLAARSVVAHNGAFQKYYIRKLAEGKERRLVLNNVVNKLIKIACAVIKNNSRYVKARIVWQTLCA